LQSVSVIRKPQGVSSPVTDSLGMTTLKHSKFFLVYEKLKLKGYSK